MATANDIMTTDLLTLDVDTPMGEAIEALAAKHVSGAPVVRNGELVGIISELEMFDVLFDTSLRSAPVWEFMTRDVITIEHTEPLGRIAHLFALYRVRRIPVLQQGKLVGLVSRRDLLRFSLSTEKPLQEPLRELMSLLDEEPFE